MESLWSRRGVAVACLHLSWAGGGCLHRLGFRVDLRPSDLAFGEYARTSSSHHEAVGARMWDLGFAGMSSCKSTAHDLRTQS